MLFHYRILRQETGAGQTFCLEGNTQILNVLGGPNIRFAYIFDWLLQSGMFTIGLGKIMIFIKIRNKNPDFFLL